MAVAAAPSEADFKQTAVKVVRKHHILVRVSHWLNIPLLLGLTLSGLSIYWAAPVYQHAPQPFPSVDSSSGQPFTDTTTDYFATFGLWVCKHLPGQSHYPAPADWFYNHFSLGTGELSAALNLHWLFAYLFMANGVLYVAGLIVGGGYRSLLPRRGDFAQALSMIRFYLGVLPAKLANKAWPHPHISTKYNALQRSAYFSMPIAGILAVASGWALHKGATLGWLQGLFRGYDTARIWHFWIMWFFVAFVIPHVVLVIADGFDTFRSMVVGWSIKCTVTGDKTEFSVMPDSEPK